MASKKKLPITIPAAVTVDPEKVAIKSKGLKGKIKAAFQSALTGVQFTGAGDFRVSPQIKKLDRTQFAAFKKQYAEDTDKLAASAKAIDAKRVASGDKATPQSLLLQKVQAESANVRRATESLFTADKAINDRLQKKLLSGPNQKLTANELKKVSAKFDAGQNLLTAMRGLGKFQQNMKDVFDPALGKQVTLTGQAIQGLNTKIAALAKQQGILKTQLSGEVKTQKAISNARSESVKKTNAQTQATQAFTNAQSKGLSSLKQYRKELQNFNKFSPLFASDQKRIADASSKLAGRSRQKAESIDAVVSKYGDNLSPRQLRELASLKKDIVDLDTKAVARARELGALSVTQKSKEAETKSRVASERAVTAEKKKQARIDGALQKSRRNTISDLRKQQRSLRDISKVQATTASQARTLSTQSRFIADQARVQANKAREAQATALSAGVSRSDARIKSLADNTRRLDKVFASATTQSQRFTSAQANLVKAADKASDAKRRLGEASKGLNKQLSQSSLLIRQFFRFALGYGALFQVLGAINALKTSVLELDKALFSIKAITDATEGEMIKISGAIKRVAIETKFTTKEVAKAAQVLSQAGVVASDLPVTLEAVSKFAAGTETDIAIAADLVSTMRNVFTELDDIDITNQLTKAINISKLTGTDLRTILGISAQVAKQYNLTAQNYLSAVTVLRNAGLKASTTATGLRQALNELFSPDTKTLKALAQRYKEIGENLRPADIKDRFFGFSQELNPVLAAARELKRLGLTGSGKKTLARGFDIRAANALTALVNGLDQLESAQTKLASGDQVFKASATQMESLSNSVDNLGAAMTVLAANISEGPLRSLEDLVDAATNTVQALTELDIAAKSLGREGASQILETAGTGAFVGALAGRTPIGRFAGGIAGAVGGGLLGAEQLKTRAEGGTNLIDPAALNAAVATVGVISLIGSSSAFGKISGVLKSNGGFTKVLARTTSGVSGLVGTITSIGRTVGTVALSAGRLLAGFSGIGAVLLTAYTAANLFLDDEQDRQTRQKRQREALKSRTIQIESERQKIDSELAQSQTFRASDFTEGSAFEAKKGSVSAVIEANVRLAERYTDTFAQVFTDLGDSKRQEIENLLDIYRDNFEKGTPGWKAAVEAIKNATGITSDEQFEELEPAINFLANRRSELVNASTAQLLGLQKTLEQAFVKDPEDRSDSDNAYITTLAETAEELDVVKNSLINQTVTDVGEFSKSVSFFFDRYSSNVDALRNIDTRTDSNREASLKADIEAVRQALEFSTSTDELDTKIKVLEKSFRGIGEGASKYIDEVIVLLEESKKLFTDRQAVLAPELAASSAGGTSTPSGAGGAVALKEVLDRRDIQEEQANLSEAVGRLDKTLEAYARASDQTGKILANSNAKTTSSLAVVLTAVGTLTKGDLGTFRQEGFDPKLSALLERLQADPGARADFLDSNVREKPTGGVILTAEAKALIEFIRAFTATASESLPEQPAKLAFQRDPETYRKIFELDRQIADAKKNNLALLIEENESNPIFAKRDLLATEKDREIVEAQTYLSKLIAFHGIETGDIIKDQKVKKTLSKARADLAKLQIARSKIDFDAEAAQETQARRFVDLRLTVETEKLKLAEEALERQRASAIGAGNAEQASKIVGELHKVQQDLLDLDLAKLQLSQQDNELSRLTIIEKNDQLRLSQSLSRILTRQEALAARQTAVSSRLTGSAVDQGRQSFLEASGSGRTNQQNLEESSRQLQVALGFAFKKRNLANEAFSTARNTPGTSGKVLLELELAAVDATEEVGALAGEFQRTQQLLTEMGFAYEDFRQVWQASTQDMTAALHNEILDWYQQGPRTIRNFLESLRDGISVGLQVVFQKLADQALERVVKKGMDSVLEFLDIKIGTTKEDVAINADNVTITKQSLDGSTSDVVIDGGSGNIEPILGDVDGTEDPLAFEEFDPDTEEEAGVQAENEIAAETAQALLTGNIESLTAQMLANLLFERTSQVADVTAAATRLTALTANTAALIANTTALAAGGGGSGISSLVSAGIGALSGGGESFYDPGLTGTEGSFASGGIIKGRGTKTSDSLRGIIVGKNGRREGIKVSPGEGVLTANAVDFLGEDFVHGINSMKLPAFASGGVIGKSETGVARLKDSIVNMSAPEVHVGGPEIYNVLDPDLIRDTMRDDEGGKVIINHLQKNARGISSLLTNQ